MRLYRTRGGSKLHFDEDCDGIESGQAGASPNGYGTHPVESVELGSAEINGGELCENCKKRHPDWRAKLT